MLRTKRDQEQLRDASEHLFYELWMLDRITRLLAMGAFGEGPVKNACLESFTLHARVLLHFFFPIAPRDDDVLAEDFFADQSAWEGIRGEVPPALGTISRRVGKEVAHLTYARLDVSGETKPWRFKDIAEELNQIAGRFRSRVTPEFLGPLFAAGDSPDAASVQ